FALHVKVILRLYPQLNKE
ncbi:hypothetical protein NPIL_692841, partial [Nephila pilipes]